MADTLENGSPRYLFESCCFFFFNQLDDTRKNCCFLTTTLDIGMTSLPLPFYFKRPKIFIFNSHLKIDFADNSASTSLGKWVTNSNNPRKEILAITMVLKFLRQARFS